MFNELFSIDNFFRAWRKFKSGKSHKKDVVSFEYHLEDNIFSLYDDVVNKWYKHKSYAFFQIFDNKKRDIYKADVRDRIIHQIIYEYLTSLYEPFFISDSYSSRDCKGHHKAVKTLQYFIKIVRTENYGGCFVLKFDIEKYFNTIDHSTLLAILRKKVSCPKIFNIIQEVVLSFNSKIGLGKGIPLGNITSQIFANIYLHSLDVYIKKELSCRFYVRYNDDFVIVSDNPKKLEDLKRKIIDFVSVNLKLNIPIEKTSIRKVAWGIDFLGFIILPNAVFLRGKTKGKIFSNINEKNIDLYWGILKHCNSYFLKQKVLSKIKDLCQ